MINDKGVYEIKKGVSKTHPLLRINAYYFIKSNFFVITQSSVSRFTK